MKRATCAICGIAEANSAGLEVRRFSLIQSCVKPDGRRSNRSYGMLGLCAECWRAFKAAPPFTRPGGRHSMT